MKGNHHIIDQRAVTYLQQLLSESQTINHNFVDEVIFKESVGGFASMFKSLSSKPFLISMLYEMAEKIVAG